MTLWYSSLRAKELAYRRRLHAVYGSLDLRVYEVSVLSFYVRALEIISGVRNSKTQGLMIAGFYEIDVSSARGARTMLNSTFRFSFLGSNQ